MVRETYEAIKDYHNKNEIVPSLTEILTKVSYTSKSTVIECIKKLEELGYIKVIRNENGNMVARGIIILKIEWEE